MKITTTVILINYNNNLDTYECIKSLLLTKYPGFQVYVLDNTGNKQEFDKVKKNIRSTKVRWFFSKKNLGFAGGNNFILRKVRSKYTVLLNNDTVVDPKWLNQLIRYAENNPEIAILQPKIKSYYKHDYFEYAGGAGGYMDFFGYPYAAGRIGFSLEEDIGQYDKPRDIFWASGAAFFVKTELFKKVGYLAESFFFYHEETDLCWRAINKGYRIQSCPSSVIYHKGASSSKNNMPRRIFYVHRNNLFMIARNYNIILLPMILIIRFLLDFVSAFFYLIQGNLKYLLSEGLAWLSFITKIFQIYAFRKYENNWLNGSYRVLSPVSVYLLYFIFGKKRYGNLVHKVFTRTKIIPYKLY